MNRKCLLDISDFVLKLYTQMAFEKAVDKISIQTEL